MLTVRKVRLNSKLVMLLTAEHATIDLSEDVVTASKIGDCR
jgi:hypothetical protein